MNNEILTIFQALLTCLSKDVGETKLNTKNVTYNNTLVLKHKDIFTIGDRSFRWEYPEESQHLATASPKKTPKKSTPAKNATNNSNNNSHANGVAKKGEGYGVMSPKAKAAAKQKCKQIL